MAEGAASRTDHAAQDLSDAMYEFLHPITDTIVEQVSRCNQSQKLLSAQINRLTSGAPPFPLPATSPRAPRANAQTAGIKMEQSRFRRDIFKVVGGLISPTLDAGKQSKVKPSSLSDLTQRLGKLR